MRSERLLRRFYPESNISGFSHVDGTVVYYTQIAAVVRPTDYVLDFGAGRGAAFQDDDIEYRRQLQNLKGRCRHLDGCDVDDEVLDNPLLDRAQVHGVDAPLPYEDNRFDVVIARAVFEHVADPRWTAQELLRVVKPGGLIAAFTPNKWGYIALGARIVPNKLHARALAVIQPDRKAEDVFPTHYRMNTPSALRRAFGDGAEIFICSGASEPAYHFNRPSAYRVVKWLNKHLPASVQPILYVYIRKR